MRNGNTFATLLSLLKVKHTSWYSEKLFEEHPNKNNLLGLSQMLSSYNIANEGVRIADKDNFDISAIKVPFIAQMGSSFVVVSETSADTVTCTHNGYEISIDVVQFKRSWTGILLLAEANSESVEPGYKANRKQAFINSFKRYLFLLVVIVPLVYAFMANRIYNYPGLVLSMLVNGVGFYVCYLLVGKQLHIQSRYADKLCSVFKKSNCNDVLETDAAKLFGVIGWSEIGLGYFASGIIIIVLFPHFISYLVLVNIAALPYSFWSVWYQKTRAKQWCPMCLIIQLVFWLIFAVHLIFGYISIPDFVFSEVLIIGAVYAISILGISEWVSVYSNMLKGKVVVHELNSFKTSEEIFSALLQKQPRYKFDTTDSQIVFGNPKARLRLTIFSNPHCNPCARMHSRADKLLHDLGDDVALQYIFTSFTSELESSALHLIAIYFNKGPKLAEAAFVEWFKTGSSNRDMFFEKYGQDISTAQVQEEYERHRRWGTESGLNATPTVMVNNYLLPGIYKIEDMKFFACLEVDTKYP